MTDSLRELLAYMARGLKDSLVGTLKVFQFDNDTDSEETEEVTKPAVEQATSTLARRRAERLRQKEPKVVKKPKVKQRILLCCGWNGGLFLLSILLFNHVVLPSLKFLTRVIFGGSAAQSVVWSWTYSVLSWTFGALWILPLFVLSKIINSLWFQDIADAAYRKSRGRPQLLPSLSKGIADVLFSLLLQSLFLIQGMLVSHLPITGLGNLLYMLHMCLLYSLYAFEYKWFNMGWEVHKRLSYIEINWPYFVGFGLPLALLTAMPASHIISGCLFSIFFPLFIISGNEAEPLHQSFHYSLRLFSPVIAVSNAVFHHSVKKTQQTSSAASTPSHSASPARKVKVQSKR